MSGQMEDPGVRLSKAFYKKMAYVVNIASSVLSDTDLFRVT